MPRRPALVCNAVGTITANELRTIGWIHGSPSAKHNDDPDLQVRLIGDHTVVMRQNKAIDYEAPFLYLLFGSSRALLLDTGATASPDLFPLRAVVDELVDNWLTDHPHRDYELLVMHSHGHGDHVAADGQFADRAATTVVDASLDAMSEWFRAQGGGPEVRIDLGQREVTVLADAGAPSDCHHGVRPPDATAADRGHRLPRTPRGRGLGRVHGQSRSAAGVRREPSGGTGARCAHRDDRPARGRLPDPHDVPAARGSVAPGAGATGPTPRRCGRDRYDPRMAHLREVHRLPTAPPP